MNPQGVIIGEQKDFTQNNTAGIDPSAFVQLGGYVGQISGTLNMSEPDRVELERVAQELHAEATLPNPEPGRMRQITTQVKTMLVEAGATAAAQVGIQMGANDPDFPASADKRGAELLYRIGDLKKWVRNRPRGAAGTTDVDLTAPVRPDVARRASKRSRLAFTERWCRWRVIPCQL
ncbi:hypothetical protein [Streptomyces hirsutus]|uniref:hypothetical protein n=1 Tax=Streptomyces hirsutus TaxID=35620 RepID=UPI0006E15C89|nr:hypothetical protein [Streptomyces hirsutus]